MLIEGEEITDKSTLKFASWNIRTLSDGSRNDTELDSIVDILDEYDLIAIIELKDEEVLKRIQNKLSEKGLEYQYIISPPVGAPDSSHREHYCFLYRLKFIEPLTIGELYPDLNDSIEDFVRDPFWATFKSGNFDFSIIVCHIVWGDTVGPRKLEIKALKKVYEYVQKENGLEQDIILCGDFNRNISDSDTYSNILSINTMKNLFEDPQKSHIKDSSLYDNIFFQTKYTKEFTGDSGINKFDEIFFENDDEAANLAVSDHRPVWAIFRTDLPLNNNIIIKDKEGNILLDNQISSTYTNKIIKRLSRN